MEKQMICSTMLLRGMSAKEAEHALKVMRAEEKSYRKNEIILLSGTTTDKMGLVLSGSVTIESNDIWGNRTILAHVEEGHYFGESYAVLNDEPMMVDAVANENSTILFLHMDCLQQLELSAELWMGRLVTNLLAISVQKNLALSHRSFHTAPKTIRGRVMSYLNAAALRMGRREFDIPFDRQQLADYLNLERSALSKELSKMQKEGIITVKKNHFTLKTDQNRF